MADDLRLDRDASRGGGKEGAAIGVASPAKGGTARRNSVPCCSGRQLAAGWFADCTRELIEERFWRRAPAADLSRTQDEVIIVVAHGSYSSVGKDCRASGLSLRNRGDGKNQAPAARPTGAGKHASRQRLVRRGRRPFYLAVFKSCSFGRGFRFHVFSVCHPIVVQGDRYWARAHRLVTLAKSPVDDGAMAERSTATRSLDERDRALSKHVAGSAEGPPKDRFSSVGRSTGDRTLDRFCLPICQREIARRIVLRLSIGRRVIARWTASRRSHGRRTALPSLAETAPSAARRCAHRRAIPRRTPRLNRSAARL